MSDVTVYVYKLNREELRNRFDELRMALPLWRREKVERLNSEEARLVSLAAGSLLSKVLPEAKEGVRFGEYGKPILNKAGCYFNLSHSKDYVALAVAEENVGLDIEGKEDRDFLVTKRMFTEEEKAFVQKWEEEKKGQDAFKLIWTGKEAYLKCKGIGISVPLKSFCTIMDAEESFVWEENAVGKETPVFCEEDGQWIESMYSLKKILFQSESGESYAISTCMKKNKFTLDMKWVKCL